MLHLKTHKLTLPHLSASPELRLSPVRSEDDELIHAIEDPINDIWRLEATPDTRELNQFWTGVEEDLKHDPTWFNFTDDDEQ